MDPPGRHNHVFSFVYITRVCHAKGTKQGLLLLAQSFTRVLQMHVDTANVFYDIIFVLHM